MMVALENNMGNVAIRSSAICFHKMEYGIQRCSWNVELERNGNGRMQ